MTWAVFINMCVVLSTAILIIESLPRHRDTPVLHIVDILAVGAVYFQMVSFRCIHCMVCQTLPQASQSASICQHLIFGAGYTLGRPSP
jgi:hypothetical protein